jgi:hypothetical protein
LYDEKESSELDLLKEHFEDLGRDEEGHNAVFMTWAISFDRMRRQDACGSILSLMSFFD